MGRKLKGGIDEYRGKFRVRIKGALVGLFDTEEEAADALAVARGAAAYDRGEPGALITLRPYGERFFEEREKAGFVRSVSRERSVWRTHILTAPFIDWPVKRLGDHRKTLKKWLESLASKTAVNVHTTRGPDGQRVSVYTETDRPLSKKTIQHARHVLRQILAEAVDDKLIRANPIDEELRVKIRARIREEEIWTFLTETEIRQVFDYLTDDFDRAFFSVAIYAGLRQGEILGLRWRDVIFDRNAPRIDVRRNRTGPVKTSNSVRSVPMLFPLYEALREWQAACHLEAAKGRRLRDTVIDINALVFPADHGGCFHAGYDAGWRTRRYRKNGVLREYPGIKVKAGVERPGVTFHALRHTCASHLAMGTAGFPRASKDEIARVLGHSSTRVTERYMHLDPAAFNARVGRLFRFELNSAEQREAADAAG